MKKSIAPLLFGILFILAGLGFLGNALFDWNFNIMFDGWWTLFIIVPSFVSILANGPRSFNIIAFLIGVLLLLSRQLPHFFDYRYTGITIVAVVIIGIGISLISSFFRKPQAPTYYTYQQNPNCQAPPPQGNGANYQTQGATGTYAANEPQSGSWPYDENPFPNYNAVFSGTTARNTASSLEGARISAICGGVDLDLRNAIVTHDITIYITSFMGGVDIFAPRNVKIALNKTDILGGTDCIAYTMPANSDAPMVTFVCTTILGGIDIK